MGGEGPAQLRCGCRVLPGAPVGYGGLRAHITTHVEAALKDAILSCLYLELIGPINHAVAAEIPVAQVRLKVMEALTQWQEQARAAVEAVVPHNPIREVLG